MSVALECIGCRKLKEFSGPSDCPVCEDCKQWEKERREKDELEMKIAWESAHPKKDRQEKSCYLCGYKGPAIDEHHIHGRKVSDETVTLCSNCHREVHAGIIKL